MNKARSRFWAMIGPLVVSSVSLGCGSAAPDDVGVGLLAGDWVLESLAAGGLPLSSVPGVDVTLHLGEDPIEGRSGWFTMESSTGCNRATGSYQPSPEGGLNVGMLAVTERGCAPEIMDVEVVVLMSLERAEGFTVDANTLVVTSPVGDMTWVRP